MKKIKKVIQEYENECQNKLKTMMLQQDMKMTEINSQIDKWLDRLKNESMNL